MDWQCQLFACDPWRGQCSDKIRRNISVPNFILRSGGANDWTSWAATGDNDSKGYFHELCMPEINLFSW